MNVRGVRDILNFSCRFQGSEKYAEDAGTPFVGYHNCLPLELVESLDVGRHERLSPLHLSGNVHLKFTGKEDSGGICENDEGLVRGLLVADELLNESRCS